MTDPQLSVVVPTRGFAGLERCLAALARGLDRVAAPTEIVVAEDGVRTGVEDIRGARAIRRLSSVRRLGFGPTANAGVAAARAPAVVVVNDDVLIEPGSLATLLEALTDEHLGVCPAVLADDPGGAVDESLYRLTWERDRPRVRPTPAGVERAPDYLSGTFALFRRAAFLELGGYHGAFAPYYWEDVDLGLLARARAAREPGWAMAHVPAATARHLRHGSVRAERWWFRKTVYRRNRILLGIRHLSAPDLRTRHARAVVRDALAGLARGDASAAAALLWAVQRARVWRLGAGATGALDALARTSNA